MTVLDLLDEIEDIVETASVMPLTNKIMIDGNELTDIVKEIRISLPDDVQQAKWVKDEKHRILSEAKEEYERIIVEAKKQASYLVEEHDITQQAYQRREEIRQESEGIRREAEEYSRVLKLRTFEYLDKILDDMQSRFDDVNANYLNQLFNQMSRQFDDMNGVLQTNRDELRSLATGVRREDD